MYTEKMTKKTQNQLRREIDTIKRQLVKLAGLRPGSLSEQYNVCGNPNCKCKDKPPRKHGPYPQLSFTRKGRSTTRFVRKPDVARIKKEVQNYTTLRELIDRWIEMETVISEIKTAESREAMKAS